MFVFQLPIHTNLAHAVIWAWVVTSFFVHCITPNCYQMIKKCFIIIILQIAVFYKKFQTRGSCNCTRTELRYIFTYVSYRQSAVDRSLAFGNTLSLLTKE